MTKLEDKTNTERENEIAARMKDEGFDNIKVEVSGLSHHWVTVSGERNGGR